MKITIRRKTETNNSIIGEMWFDSDTMPEGFTLEPSRTTPVHPGHPCVPAGIVYKVILTKSPHFGYVTPELVNVPGRSEIRWHKGNDPKDTLGCTLVAEKVGPQPDWVSQSKEAFEHLMGRLQPMHDAGEEITAVYLDPQ
jgi:hypothetical protein